METARKNLLGKNPLARTLKIRRYDEAGGSSVREFEVPFDEDLTVLDALNEIKDTEDGTLTFRFSCRMGICGSCGATVNGKPVLLCGTYLRDLPRDKPAFIEPMRNFPVIKDLVVDIDSAMEKIRSVMPYTTLMERNLAKDGPNTQSPKDRKKIDQTSQCIKCMLCYSACPVVGLDKNFVGPAASATAYRYDKDSREKSKEAKDKRMDRMTQKDGVWSCSFVGECSVVCPKRVDPAMAIQKLKMQGVLHLGKKLLTKKKYDASV